MKCSGKKQECSWTVEGCPLSTIVFYTANFCNTTYSEICKETSADPHKTKTKKNDYSQIHRGRLNQREQISIVTQTIITKRYVISTLTSVSISFS